MKPELKTCPICGKEIDIEKDVYIPERDWKPSFYDPDSGGDPISVNCECGFRFCIATHDWKDFSDIWNGISRNDKGISEDLVNCRNDLLNAFLESFIDDYDEFIAFHESEEGKHEVRYFLSMQNCKSSFDIKCKLLEWFSRPAYKSTPFHHDENNERLHKFMLNGINTFLHTNFTKQDMAEIYQKLGNGVRHSKTIQFVESGYDLEVLRSDD